MTVAEIRDGWHEDEGVPRPGKRTIAIDLKHGAAVGDWIVSGAGTKGDPHLYRLQNAIRAGSASLGARNESSSEVPDGIPDGWNRESWIARLQKLAEDCEAVHPKRAAELRAEAEEVARAV